ncbi:hypothetical protein GRS96_12525 [Rathayibacter sp. VKM Ac-2803]|uniref:hypothetical protein n=1 Tax=Rathayibacter sp. VKM Ac-2803 TaxID=2609256 RepID=UPI0013591027|nr:hypothetical protein [Rathayibacter sp. VKM Ac-2803]MWV50094.1 hypothetical protein [Rathayibacter sp. VKM Ac-2803]
MPRTAKLTHEEMTSAQRSYHYRRGCTDPRCLEAHNAMNRQSASEKPVDERRCWRCGIDFLGHDRLTANAPCLDCRLVLRTLDGETTRWRGQAATDAVRTFDPAIALVLEEAAA